MAKMIVSKTINESSNLSTPAYGAYSLGGRMQDCGSCGTSSILVRHP